MTEADKENEVEASSTPEEAETAAAEPQPESEHAAAPEAPADEEFGDFDEPQPAPAAVPEAPPADDDDDDFGDFSSEPTPVAAPPPAPAPAAAAQAAPAPGAEIIGLQGPALVKAISNSWASAFGQQAAPAPAGSLDASELQVLQAAQQQAASQASSCDGSLRYAGLPLNAGPDEQPGPRLSGVPSWRDTPSEARLLQSLGLSEVAAQAKAVEAAEAAAAAAAGGRSAHARAGSGAARPLAGIAAAGQAPWTATGGQPMQEPLSCEALNGGPAGQQGGEVKFIWSDEQPEEEETHTETETQQTETDGRPVAPLPAAQYVLQRLGERHTYMGWRDDLRAWEELNGVLPACVLAEVASPEASSKPASRAARVYVPADPTVVPVEDASAGPDLLGDELDGGLNSEADSWVLAAPGSVGGVGSVSTNPYLTASPGAGSKADRVLMLQPREDVWDASLPLPPPEPLALQEVLGAFRRPTREAGLPGGKSERGTPRSEQPGRADSDAALEVESELDRALHLAVTALDEATATAAAVVACMAAVEQLSTSTTAMLESWSHSSAGGGAGGGSSSRAVSGQDQPAVSSTAQPPRSPRIKLDIQVMFPGQGVDVDQEEEEGVQGSGHQHYQHQGEGAIKVLLLTDEDDEDQVMLFIHACQLSISDGAESEAPPRVQVQLTVVSEGLSAAVCGGLTSNAVQEEAVEQQEEELEEEMVVQDELFGALRQPPAGMVGAAALDAVNTLDEVFSSQLVSALRSMSSRVRPDLALPEIDPLHGLDYDQAAQVAAHALELAVSSCKVEVPPLEAAQAAALLEALERGRFYDLVNDLSQRMYHHGNVQKPKSMVEAHEEEVIQRHWEWVAQCEAEAARAEAQRQRQKEADRVAAEQAAHAAAVARAEAAERQVVTHLVTHVFGSVIQAELCGSYLHVAASSPAADVTDTPPSQQGVAAVENGFTSHVITLDPGHTSSLETVQCPANSLMDADDLLSVQPVVGHHRVAASLVGDATPGSTSPASRSRGHKCSSIPAVRSAPQIAPLHPPDLLLSSSSSDSSTAGHQVPTPHAWDTQGSSQDHAQHTDSACAASSPDRLAAAAAGRQTGLSRAQVLEQWESAGGDSSSKAGVPAGVQLISLSSSSGSDGEECSCGVGGEEAAQQQQGQGHAWIDNPLAQLSDTWGGASDTSSPTKSGPSVDTRQAAEAGPGAGQGGVGSCRAGDASEPTAGSAAAHELVQALSRLMTAGVRLPQSYVAPAELLASVRDQVAACSPACSPAAVSAHAVRPEALQVVDLVASGLLPPPRQVESKAAAREPGMNTLPRSPAKLFSARAWDPTPRPALSLDPLPEPDRHTAAPSALAHTSPVLSDLQPSLAFALSPHAARQHLRAHVCQQQQQHSNTHSPAAAPAEWLSSFRAAASSKSPSKTSSPANRPPGALTSPAVYQSSPAAAASTGGSPACVIPAFQEVDPLMGARAEHTRGTTSPHSSSPYQSPTTGGRHSMMRPQSQQRLAIHVWSRPSIASPTSSAAARLSPQAVPAISPLAVSSYWPGAGPHVKHHVPLLAAWQPGADAAYVIGSYWPQQTGQLAGGVLHSGSPARSARGSAPPPDAPTPVCDADGDLVCWNDNPVASPTSPDPCLWRA